MFHFLSGKRYLYQDDTFLKKMPRNSFCHDFPFGMEAMEYTSCFTFIFIQYPSQVYHQDNLILVK